MGLFEFTKIKLGLIAETNYSFALQRAKMVMQKHLLLLFLFSIAIKTNAQFTYTFEKMDVLDTIYDNGTILKMKENSRYLSPDYFTVPGVDKLIGLILIAKEKNYWLALSMPADDSYQDIHLQYTDKYAYYETRLTHAARGILGSETSFNIVDLKQKSYVSFPTNVTLEQWNSEDTNAVPEESSCISTVVFDGNELTAFSTGIGNGAECLESGVYTIENNKLIKIKQYDRQQYRMVPIHWAAEFATWMTIEQIKAANTYVIVNRTEDAYSSCAEDERPAYTVVEGNDTLAVVLTNVAEDKYVEKIIVLSPRIKFGNISTALTAQQVLKLYPKATITASDLTDDEYITLDEITITLVFKNTTTNRVGYYVNENYKKLQRPAAKIDYIQVN